jgi:hypothetical protein
MTSPNARKPNDKTISNNGILLRLVNWTVFPMIGGSIRGRYSDIVIPMNPIAIVCIAMSYEANRNTS